jgi:glycosyltransferase involved in cell wall biosynthesis
VLKQADLVRVVSARTKKHFIEKGIKNIVTLPVVVDSTPFLEAQPDEQVREMFGDGTFVFLSVARFVPQKNFPLLLKAFALAYEQNNNIRLLIVGTGQEEENMRNIISQFKSETQSAISILPWSNNVAGLMKSASAYILSSNYEGWGRVLVEAVLAKLPIVTTAVGAADEVVKHEVQGLVVPVDDVEALSKAMVYLSTDESLYRRLKENLTKITGIPGTDKEQYQTQWAQVFLSE